MSSDIPTKKAVAKKPAEHPKYIEMIVAAIGALKERTGSSRQAIEKYIMANYKVGDNSKIHLRNALKRGVSSGALLQPKGTGASGSFKLAKPVPAPKKNTVAKKPAKPAAAKKPAAKKPASAKKTTPKKKTAAKSTPKKKKPAAKKSVSAKKPASAKKSTKKPVAAKKPAAKKAKKTPTKKKAAKK